MKQYFIDKLKDSVKHLEGLQKSIVEAAASLDLKKLMELPQVLTKAKEEYSTLVKDCVKYCTVDEVLEIADLKDWHGTTTLNLLEVNGDYTVSYAYSYNKPDGVTLGERDRLVKRFGYRLKDIKVK